MADVKLGRVVGTEAIGEPGGGVGEIRIGERSAFGIERRSVDDLRNRLIGVFGKQFVKSVRADVAGANGGRRRDLLFDAQRVGDQAGSALVGLNSAGRDQASI